MKYSEVLSECKPTEIGDFMYRYYINGREYIIFSPSKGKISCLELCNFNELTPYQLAVSIQQVPVKPEEEIKEFSFEHVCTKEALISYLFDVLSDSQEGALIKRRVSDNRGYFLYALKPTQTGTYKVKNLYQFDPESKRYQLVFDNDLCCASIFDEVESDTINVCWNPVIFNLLEGQTEQKNTSYLLASANAVLCFHVCKKTQERSSKINLYVGNNYLESLYFISYYMEFKDMGKRLYVSSDDKKITIRMKGWEPVKVVNCMARAEKACAERLKKLYGEDFQSGAQIYQLEAVANFYFIVLPLSPLAVETFLKNIIRELKMEEISYVVG